MAHGKQPARGADDPTSKFVCRNRKARHDYEILDELVCGIVLCGSEVKSVRAGKITIEDSFARVRNDELWLVNANIGEYPQANLMNHDMTQPRKLLLHRRELRKFAERGDEKGFTLIPLDVFFERGYVKVTIAIARGRKEHDHRETIRREVHRKEMRSAMLKHQR